MSETVICSYQECWRSQIEEIFFDSSTKKIFKDEAEKKLFNEKYLGYYLRTYADFCLVAIKDQKVMGYVLGSPLTPEALFFIQPHLEKFSQYFEQYPAHLHINCHHESRGQGLGSKLILEFETKIQDLGICGLHIMTGPNSQNRSFYKKLGFNFQTMEAYEESPILMMGKSLTSLVKKP